MSERRNFQRVPFATVAEIYCNEKKYSGELLDISLQGALIQGAKSIPLEDGKSYELLIQLVDSEVTMKFDVTLVHREEDRFGFRFIGEDTETMIHH
jgi:c-di-GMP-binding flagellar brake protein YcgR